MSRPKRIAAIHDLSAFGRCSLTAAIPILSAMGHQVLPVPTAVLSAHTGFPGFVMRETGDFVPECLMHWQGIPVEVECIYSGFLAGTEQVGEVERYLSAYPQALAVVDPVLGDDGAAYATITPSLIAGMRRLVRRAGIITPNLTEACLLLGVPYERQVSLSRAAELTRGLCALGPSLSILTGVEAETGLYNVGYSKEAGRAFAARCEYLPIRYPGTGDVFASVLVGACTAGESPEHAVALASRFVEEALRETMQNGGTPAEGVYFEPVLPLLRQAPPKGRIKWL